MNNNPVITFHPLTQKDAPFLCSIFKDNAEYYQIFFDPANTLQEWDCRVARFLTQDSVRHHIIAANRNPVGWLSYYDEENGLRELCILVLHPHFLGMGYGSQSLRLLIDSAKADRRSGLLLHVAANNTRAIRLYQKHGFEITGKEIIPECNDAVNLAQYIMQLNLA